MPIFSSSKVLLSHAATKTISSMSDIEQKAVQKELRELNRLYNNYHVACRKADSIIGTMTTSQRKLVENMQAKLDKIMEFEEKSKYHLVQLTVVKLENYTRDEDLPDYPALDEYDISKMEKYPEGWVEPLNASLQEQKQNIDGMLKSLPKAEPGLFSKLKNQLLDIKGSDSPGHDNDSKPKL